MKWNNKGHEFDYLGSRFGVKKKIVIYGAGEWGEILYHKLAFEDCVKCFIDNDIKKQESGYMGKCVVGIVDYLTQDKKDAIVVVAASRENRPIIMQQMRRCGYIDGENLFDVEAFIEFYLSIYAFYSWNKLYFHSVGTAVTTQCNLRCKGCLCFVPFNQNRKHYDVKGFKESVDDLFKVVDFLDIFQLSGGEVFLYPDQVELLNYIGGKYRGKINHLYTTTNGTIIPSDELCICLNNNNVEVILDDYTDTVPQCVSTIEKIVEKFKRYGVSYKRNKVETWIDLAPNETDNSDFDEKKLACLYSACAVPWVDLFESKLFSCDYTQYASRAGIVGTSDNDYFDLKKVVNRKELLEFRMGYTEKGYVELCKRCSGYVAINKNIIAPADQGK